MKRPGPWVTDPKALVNNAKRYNRDLCRTVHQIAGDPSFYIPAPESDFFMLRSMIDETDAARTAIGFQEHFKFPGRSDEVPCIVVDMGTITGLNFEEGGTW